MVRYCILLFLLLLTIFLPAQNRHHPDDPFAGLDTTFARVLSEFYAAGRFKKVTSMGLLRRYLSLGYFSG